MIFVMTVRDDFQATANISNLFEFSCNCGVLVLVGYGGKNDSHFAELGRRAEFYNGLGAEIKLYQHESLIERLAWATGHQIEWVLFVSDDDPVTTNHAESYLNFIENPENDLSNISAVVPKTYFVTSNTQLKIYEPENFIHESPEGRLRQLLLAPYVGIRFWSAYRTESIRRTVEESFEHAFMPSYFDQLLVFSASLKGDSVNHGGVGGVFYDLSNWATPENAIRSDLRFYANPGSVLFHEIYWARDYRRLLSHLDPEPEFVQFFKNYCLSRIDQSLLVFPLRVSILTSASMDIKTTARHSYEAILLIKEQINKSISWDDIKYAMEFRKTLNLQIDDYIQLSPE